MIGHEMERFKRRIRRGTLTQTAANVAVLTVLWALFFWRLWTPTPEDRVIFAKGDFPLHYFSYSDYQAERMWQGEIPLWNPYNYGGDPFAANVQWAVWYPPRWIALLIAGEGGWGIEALQLEVAAHYWVSSLLMLAFLMVLFKRPLPALAGSILWSYGGYLTGYPMLQPSILEAITWLPLLMLGVHLGISRERWRVWGMVIGSIAIALSFFGGHTQTTLHMTYFAGAYLLVTGWQHGLRWRALLWRGALLVGLGTALAAVQLLPAIELTRNSFRAGDYHYWDKSVGFTVSELAHFVWPRLFNAEYWPLYAGVAGLLLAGGTLFRLQKRHQFWLGVIVLTLFLSLGRNSVVFDIFYLIVPGFSMFREQERAAALLMFSLVVLAVDQFAWLLDRPAPADLRRFTWWARAHLGLTGLAFAVAMVYYILAEWPEPPGLLPDMLGFVALMSLLFNLWLIWWQRDARPLVPLAVVGLIVLDLFTFGMKSPNFVPDNEFNRIRPPDNMDLLSVPDSADIQWHVDGGAGIQTYGTYWRIPDIYGTGPFSLATIEELRRIRVDRRWEVLAVRYATMTGEVPDNVPTEVVGQGVNYDGVKYTVYELTDPRPMAHLVYSVRQADDLKGARDILKEPVIDLRETGVITGDLPFHLPGERPDESSVSAFRMTMPEYVEMDVSTSENALLTVAIANTPGWRAEVNGQRVDIVDNYAGLIGIPLRPGEHQKVTLHFVPTSLIAGGVISLLAMGGVIAAGVASLAARRRRGIRQGTDG